jgi:hypothetical protein
MWEPRVIYQQSYIYTTANIIRSREPLHYKAFPQSLALPPWGGSPFFLFFPSSKNISQLTCLKKLIRPKKRANTNILQNWEMASLWSTDKAATLFARQWGDV